MRMHERADNGRRQCALRIADVSSAFATRRRNARRAGYTSNDIKCNFGLIGHNVEG